jgi:hypothetical protein
VIVSSVPVGARVLRDGKALAETPDAIKIPAGETWKVIVQKDGYAEQPLTLDPAHDKKLLVKLEKLAKPVVAKKQPAVAAAAPLPPPHEEAPPPPPPKPVFVPAPRPSDPLSAAVEKLAPAGARRVGSFYSGQASDNGQHSDWFFALEGGRCYDFVATGGSGVQRLYVYLWSPNGKRATDRREGSPAVTLHYCAAQPGQYHFQAKMADGRGDYRMGIYSR